MTKAIQVGGITVGGGAPISIQSMTNTRTDDVKATLSQIRALAAAGCDIVRVAVPDMAAAKAVGKIKENCPLPLVVDIHFDYKLALEAIAAGADKVRINPGNIGGADKVKAVADACRQRGIPIRIGVNAEYQFMNDTQDNKWDKLLHIKTMGRDDSQSDQYRYPYEPTPYSVLQRLANTGLIRKNNMLLDYGCGKEG